MCQLANEITSTTAAHRDNCPDRHFHLVACKFKAFLYSKLILELELRSSNEMHGKVGVCVVNEMSWVVNEMAQKGVKLFEEYICLTTNTEEERSFCFK